MQVIGGEEDNGDDGKFVKFELEERYAVVSTFALFRIKRIGMAFRER